MVTVVIPVKDRPEVEHCVESLVKLPQIEHVLLCDGGSQQQCSYVLTKLKYLPKVQILQLSSPGFNKSYLLNQGIMHTTAELVLISDADIVWNEPALRQLCETVNSVQNSICSVQQVKESHPETIALKRDRYTYSITQEQDVAILNIQNATEQSQRPGCGLLLARRKTFLDVGGYKELFRGWGWEDQDLLIRAQLLGIPVKTAGEVLHLSHNDDQRNSFHRNSSPSFTRNRNLLAAVGSLLQQKLWGDLPLPFNRLTAPKTIRVYLPQDLRKWLHEFCCEGIADHDISWARKAFANADTVVATPTPRTTDCV